MSTVAVVAGPDPGHLFPVVALARALRDRGHAVVVVTTERWRDDLAADGLGFATLPGTAPERRDDDLGWRMWGRAAAMAPDLADVLTEVGAAAVVADTLTSAGGFAADLVGVPWVELVPHWLWTPSRVLPPVGLGMDPPRGPIARLHAAHLRRQQQRSVADGRRQRAHARRSVGLPSEGAAALRLVATLPALEPARPDWPARTFVVGALEWEPAAWPLLSPPAGDGPTVVVTDTTATGVGGALVGDALAALASEPVRIAATGAADDVPANAVVGLGRHGPLLDGADVAVGNGGHGFVAKALVRGVPVVMVPLQGDQFETSARVSRARAGITLVPEERDPATLRAAVLEILGDPRYRRAARRIARGADGLGPERAAQLLERYVLDHRPGSSRSTPTS